MLLQLCILQVKLDHIMVQCLVCLLILHEVLHMLSDPVENTM